MMKRLSLLRGLVLLLVCGGGADEVDLEVSSGLMIKMLRDMANQTSANSLNLPANASSIRENITDTFSCEDRSYGYYADVDNDCQIFHVCLPSQMPSGRNVTYRWSFICPNETVFNQEVLVCTRPEDAIECEDSPEYYDVNKEIGKEPNKTRIEEPIDNNIEAMPINDKEIKKEQIFPSRKPVKRPMKQNYIVEQIKDIDEEMNEKLTNLDITNAEVFPIVSAGENEPEGIENRDRIIITDEQIKDINEEMKKLTNIDNSDVFPVVDTSDNKPKGIENRDRIITDESGMETDEASEKEDGRLILERSMGNKRGLLRFLADV